MKKELVNKNTIENKKGESKMKRNEMTRIYKDEDGNLILSYPGINKSDYQNISLGEFIELVEDANTWDDFDPQIYESALEEVGLDYSTYSDPDEMWKDFLEKTKED